ncbi:heme NO-binding protein [Oceanicola sp. 22II-s10i]|uniref:heme NO-binding domain-containing protein n=1 Tax=Oceanicola sp. 22II-s10i TaxID=1317116 RepID=UPI000B524E4F|nr:heme NO-binding domain-containing protein [Oceanicola sp. 22II-s10i]OWU82897.1 heme NO-binding protein [Oceanicola sp. 22II-s10i]
MHGLIIQALQRFIVDTYGAGPWAAACRAMGLAGTEFEPMIVYDPALTDGLVDALSTGLSRPRPALLEDLGTYLVSTPKSAGFRRLLRFLGAGFEDFLHALDDLPDRARLAIPDMRLPVLALRSEGAGCYLLSCRSHLPGAGHVLVGVLRAMADDYGALATLDHRGETGGAEQVAVQVHVSRFAEARTFDLGARTG